jgi:tetratricopeptide (TPR) repeat protein
VKQQLILAGGGLLLLASLFFFGKTVQKKAPMPMPAMGMQPAAPTFNIDTYILSEKKKLPVYQSNYLDKTENSVVRGDVKEQQIKVDNELAAFWKDSVQQADLYIYYTGKAAELENNEKNLTFAAQLILQSLKREDDAGKKGWKAEQAIGLFNQAIELDPNNEDLKVGLGSCYVFGKGMAGDPQETMKGVMQLLAVVQKDSTNMKAQMVLGIGGVISTQYDKAIERLTTVIKNQPNNLEAVSWLADAYAGKGDKANAIKWYQISKRMVNDPEYSKEIDQRIKLLQ